MEKYILKYCTKGFVMQHDSKKFSIILPYESIVNDEELTLVETHKLTNNNQYIYELI